MTEEFKAIREANRETLLAQEQVDALKNLVQRAAEAIIWMSGSPDFAPEGRAGETFARDTRPLIDELCAALKR